MISPLFSSIVLYSYDFFSNSVTHSKCRGTTPLMSEVFILFVFRNYPQNRIESVIPTTPISIYIYNYVYR